MKDPITGEKMATREELLFLWMQLKKTIETVANEETYKGRDWRIRVEWDERKAGPDISIWIGSSNIDIPAPNFFHEAKPEDKKPKEVEVP